MSSVAYWYAEKPTALAAPPPVARRLPVLRDNQGHWLPAGSANQCPGPQVAPTPETEQAKARYKKLAKKGERQMM